MYNHGHSVIGQTLSHFKITAKLGEGGMGEVYRAEDTKLGREVAIKVLPEAVAQDPERLARFQREAKVLASLNHPNIAAIYSLESAKAGTEAGHYIDDATAGTEAGPYSATADTITFLVMELVEGEDLKERVDRGKMALEEAMPIALQIAKALEEAHEQGIVHRDLKPANVKVDPKGTTSRFWISVWPRRWIRSPMARRTPGISPCRRPLTAQMTQAGVLLGTAAYMSPEQAAGEAADRRADIWAFGLVLTEMLTGRRQFSGRTASHVLAAVLKEEPDWDRIPADTPARILDLLQHCLRKEPTQRLQAIGDARILLEDYLEDPAAFEVAYVVGTEPAGPGWKRALPWALFGLMAIAFLVVLFSSEADNSTTSSIMRAQILPPDEGIFYLAGWNPGPVAVSPDGNKMVFSIQDDDGIVHLYLQELESGVARPLPGTQSAAYPFWAPDSRWLGFFTDVDQTLKKIDTTGGPPVTICNAENGKGGTWSRDEVILFAPRSDAGIFKVSADGGEPEPLTERDIEVHNSHRHPRFLPDGYHFLYTARSGNEEQSTLMLANLANPAIGEIVRSPTQGEIAAGHLLFTRGDTLMAQPFDTDSFELTGTATPLVEEILTISGAALGVYSASDSGLLAYNTGELNPEVSLEWRDRDGTLQSTLGEPATFGPLTLSPDGKTVVSVIFNSMGISELWATDVQTGLRSRLTFDTLSNFGLDWSGEGNDLFFSAQGENGFEINRFVPGGTGETELLHTQDHDLILCSVSPDGKDVLVWQNHPNTNRDLLVRTIGEEGDPKVFRQTEADERCGDFSPDGRWIAYSSNDSGRYEVYIAPYPGPGRRWQVSQQSGLFPQWRSDGRELVFTRQNGQIMAAEIRSDSDKLQVGALQPLFRIHPPRPDGTSFALAPDGQSLLVWTNRQLHTKTVINLFVNWPATLVPGDGR